MSRKTKLAGLFAAASQMQHEGDTGPGQDTSFADATAHLDALGGLVRDLLVVCKAEKFSEEQFKKGLMGVKQSLGKCAPSQPVQHCPPLLRFASNLI